MSSLVCCCAKSPKKEKALKICEDAVIDRWIGCGEQWDLKQNIINKISYWYEVAFASTTLPDIHNSYQVGYWVAGKYK